MLPIDSLFVVTSSDWWARTQAGTVDVRISDRALRCISTSTVFGSANDVTVEELTIESFSPSDDATLEAMRSLLET
jgi:hypothetical protein